MRAPTAMPGRQLRSVGPEVAGAPTGGRAGGSASLVATARPHLRQADLVRVIAAVLVVIIHCAPWPSHATGGAASVYGALSLASRVSLPLFVILSGMFLAYTHAPGSPSSAFWARRLSRSLLPWVPWAVVYFALTVIFQGMSPVPAQSWGWWAGGAGHLFFLILIPQLYLLFVIWPKGPRGAMIAAAAAVLIQVGLQLLRVVLPIHGGAGQVLLLDYGFEEAPFWVGYFAIGILFGLHPEWLQRGGAWRWLTLPAAAGAFVLLSAGLPGRIAVNWGPWVHGTGSFLRPSLLLVTVLVFCGVWTIASALADQLRGWTRRFLASLSRHSLGIYIIHPIFLLGAGPLLEVTPRPFSLQEGLPWSLLPFGILVVGATAFGWLGTRLLASRRLTAWSVGEQVGERGPAGTTAAGGRRQQTATT
ncbi:MAG: acyltransferase [Candidatus Dormibacteria bacterium]